MNLPKSGQNHDDTFAIPEGNVRITWTTPKFKVWRHLTQLKVNCDAYYFVMPQRAADAAEALNEAALLGAGVVAHDVPAELLDLDGYDGTGPVSGAQLLEHCASADLIVGIAQQILQAGGLSHREKKASSAPPASSSTGADAPPTGTTTPPHRSVNRAAVDLEG